MTGRLCVCAQVRREGRKGMAARKSMCSVSLLWAYADARHCLCSAFLTSGREWHYPSWDSGAVIAFIVIDSEHIAGSIGISIGIGMSISIDDGMLREPVRSWCCS